MSSSSSSAQAAWQRLGDRLRELRQSANISEVRFAELAGWSDSSTVTKIERGRRRASAAHVRLWCGLCGASEQLTDAHLVTFGVRRPVHTLTASGRSPGTSPKKCCRSVRNPRSASPPA